MPHDLPGPIGRGSHLQPPNRFGLPYHEPDGDYLDLVTDVLAAGKTSRLYKRLVYDEQIATDVVAYVDLREIAGQLVIRATAKPGGDLWPRDPEGDPLAGAGAHAGKDRRPGPQPERDQRDPRPPGAIELAAPVSGHRASSTGRSAGR